MLVVQEPLLKASFKLEILRRLFTGAAILPLLEGFEAREMIEARQFIWEKTIEFGIQTRGKAFSRDDITKRMKPISWYQKEKGCKEPAQKCRATDCFYTNPECAFAMAKDQIEAMRRVLMDYLNVTSKSEG